MGIPFHQLSRRNRAYVAASDARKRQLQARGPGELFPDAAAVPEAVRLDEIFERAARGKLARENGERFEADCLTSAREAGIMLWKIPSGCRWVGPGRTVPEPTPFDFCGAIPGLGGRGMCFDAKSISADSTAQSIPIGTKFVKPHQIEALREQGAGKWISGLLVQCGPRGDVRWMDWRFLRPKERYAISWDDPKWFSVSPISCPIDFRRLVREYGCVHGG